MAKTLTELTPATLGFINNANSADFSGTEELVPAVTAKSHYITALLISCVSAINVTIGAGETGGAVTAVLLGPFYFAATAGSPINLQFSPPIKVDAATAIVADASGGGATTIVIQGYTK
jgi:hypothetical protein